MEDLKGKTVLVIGSGISGISATELLMEKGASAVLFDGNRKLTILDIEKKLSGAKVNKIIIGDVPDDLWDKIDLMVISPGVPIDSPLVNEARKREIDVWGEIELAYRLGSGMIAAITGTNGKTTTTSLVGEIFKNHFKESFVVGNIGTPYTSITTKTTDESAVAAEISSFQLESAIEFHPHISAVLNITPDHLNRHHTMENYAAVKMSITKNQTADDFCVLNYGDEVLREYGDHLVPRVIFFSLSSRLENGVYLDGDEIISTIYGKREVVAKTSDTLLVGAHNLENIMAAAAISICAGVPLETIRETIKAFKAVEHRIEFVAEKKGVIYYNDSKGTNPDASIKAVCSMTRPTVIIAGGYDKGGSFDEFIKSFDGRIKELVLIGATREKIRDCAISHGFKNIKIADSLKEAVERAAEDASPGDAVLLSPACASWDMFGNYEIRGRSFKEYVNRLEG